MFNRPFWMGVAASLAIGCGPRPIRAELPARLDVSALDSDAQKSVLAAADDWYIATDGRADVANDSARQLIVVTDIDNDDLLGETTQDDDGVIHIGLHVNFSRSGSQLHAARSEGFHIDSSDILPAIMKHELGHAFTLDHVAHTIMAAGSFGGTCIDKDTLDRMCKEYGCPHTARSTCD